MSKRTLLLLVALVAGGFAASTTSAQAAAAPVTPTVSAVTAVSLPADPYLGGALATHVVEAVACRDWGQCELNPNGTPCDTPRGCVCGWSGTKRKCGRY